ncbi:type 2 lantipeptide synthetase LanM family protein [Micromonospora sp. NIE79]|uniref:Type 2 lantipeptide synthetase LanM family protein n=1 Tax=Micromonospora trifolii TaxID=2911208 RepID=A0ABS9N255_9ACTN|nr:type 2 lanthipeptide synthetase LanM family protein [Micromonospora trifolii]MCG5444049.1 type 2 lantipeptide synthetase LanM family protein [Micromonospora trifolii]
MFDEILNAPDWWRGLTRTERGDGPPRLTAGQLDYGRRRREAWRGGHILRGKDIPLDRWDRLGINDERVIEMLGEPAESLAGRLPMPAWLGTITDAWQRFSTVRLEDLELDDHRGHRHDAQDHASDHGEIGPVGNEMFLALIAPLLAWAREELRERVEALLPVPAGGDRLPPGHALFRPPVDRLTHMIVSVMILEVNVARIEGRLPGATPRERMEAFITQIRDPEAALHILAEYPVLARELVTYLRTTVDVRARIIERLLADLPSLRATFGASWQGLGDLADISFGAGDTHRGGQAVAILTFTDGRRLVYKPRSLAVEVHFNELLDWLNRHGLSHPLRLLQVLDRGAYGWVEHVDVASCTDEAQVGRFFWRQGAHLAVFYALCGSDMHLENVIAAGEHPVLVDLEAIFQVRPGFADDRPAGLALGEAPGVIDESVLRIGLLPERIITADDEGIYDAEVSGLAGGGGQMSPARLQTYVDSGTDEIRIVRDRREMRETENRVRLDGRPISALLYTEVLADGFAECYRLILAHRDALLAPDGVIAAFRDDEVRFIPRPTMTYARVQVESYHPDLLRDMLDREIFSEVLSSWFADLPERDRLLASEQRQLAAQDVPCFHTTPSSTNLFDELGVVTHGFLDSTGLSEVRRRIDRISEDDLRRQLWCIRASMSGLTVGSLPAAPAEPQPLPSTPLDTDLAVRAAVSVADMLLTAALSSDGEAPSWLSVNFVAERFWTVGHAGIDLYSGVPGVALFLAQLGSVTGETRFRQPAQQIAEQLADAVQQLSTGDDHKRLPIGGFGELGGLVYVLSQLADLWREPALAEAAHLAATMCYERFADDEALDVIGGTAGAALAILALHGSNPDDRTAAAIAAAGARLSERAVKVPGGIAWRIGMERDRELLGFSHGASGMGYTLARIGEVTGDDRMAELCGQALHFERHHLSRERANWPDVRSTSEADAFMDTWCHGAGGIGLARAALLRLPTMAPWRDLIHEDLGIAVGRVRDDLMVHGRYVGIGNDSICHGDLGLVETLLSAGAVLGDGNLTTTALQCTRLIAEQVLAGAPRPGVPQGITTPGLMMGLAGIGYGLLRAALPDQVPNVLLLEGAGTGAGTGARPALAGLATSRT